mmetsp:Transcript_20858/g.29878  ORF Transcript_20858/g.29878 Transcript_20858/m.29878 type:complete len:88 (+) Transcript_20858:1583-1846(+)
MNVKFLNGAEDVVRYLHRNRVVVMMFSDGVNGRVPLHERTTFAIIVVGIMLIGSGAVSTAWSNYMSLRVLMMSVVWVVLRENNWRRR